MSEETYLPEIKPKTESKILIWIGYELDIPRDYKFSSEHVEDLVYAINQGKYKDLKVRRVKLDKPGTSKSYSVTVEYN